MQRRALQTELVKFTYEKHAAQRCENVCKDPFVNFSKNCRGRWAR